MSQEFSLSLLSFFFSTLPLGLLRLSIIHEVQRQERVSETKPAEESNKKGGTKRAETPQDTTVMLSAGWLEGRMFEEKEKKRVGTCGAEFVFFLFPSYIILKSISIYTDGLSSVEEIQEYDSNHNDSDDSHHDHHLAVLPPVLVL